MLRKFTNSRVEEVVALIDKNLYNVFWDRQQRGRLHFIKGVALSFGTAPNAKIAVDEFIKAYKCSEAAIHFQVILGFSFDGLPDESNNSVVMILKFIGIA